MPVSRVGSDCVWKCGCGGEWKGGGEEQFWLPRPGLELTGREPRSQQPRAAAAFPL